MTRKQMDQALRKWGISVVFNKTENRWYAGDCAQTTPWSDGSQMIVEVGNPAARNMLHRGILPEEAVEDYCNARNLEWDV